MTLSIAACKHALCLFAISCLIFSCTTTTTRTEPLQPEFAKDNMGISADVSSIVLCEHININGSKITTNNKDVSTMLTIELINPSVSGDAQKGLFKKIATAIKQDLKYPNAYNNFKVLFVKKTEHTSVSNGYVIKKDSL